MDKKAKAKELKTYVQNYQYALKALMSALPEEFDVQTELLKIEIATIGKAEIWPCIDGAMVLISQSKEKKIKVQLKQSINLTMNEFQRNHKAMYFYDKYGNRLRKSVAIEHSNLSETMVHFGGLIIKSFNNVEYRPRFQRGMIVGWNAILSDPDQMALNDFKEVFIIRNVSGVGSLSLGNDETKREINEKASNLIESYSTLLETGEREEDIQQFLSKHPELLYPDFVECKPKFKLGDDFVTDYVFLVRSQEGLVYVYVEIESVSKKIFTKSGEFTADFTHAKGQLLDWEKWVTQNHAYIAKKLPGLYKPKFHLVMGRSTQMTTEQREKLRTEFSSEAQMFSTFDDLSDRFQQIITQIM